MQHCNHTRSPSLDTVNTEDSHHIDIPCLEFVNAAVSVTTPASLVAFAHAALFSQAPSTLDRALELKLLPEFPGLTRDLLRKYPPASIATAQGHTYQARKKIKNQPVRNLEEFSSLRH